MEELLGTATEELMETADSSILDEPKTVEEKPSDVGRPYIYMRCAEQGKMNCSTVKVQRGYHLRIHTCIWINCRVPARNRICVKS